MLQGTHAVGWDCRENEEHRTHPTYGLRLATYSKGNFMYQELIKQINELSKNYFGIPEIHQLYNQDIEFTFKINDLKHEVNACIKPVFSNSDTLLRYDIEIYIGLIDVLQEYSKKCSLNYDLFHGVAKNNPEKQDKISSFLLYMWVHFIMFHEWGHAICGHAKYKKYKLGEREQDVLWLENDDSGIFQENLNLQKAMELEADSKAAPFLFHPFALIWKNYSKDLYSEVNDDYAWTDFVIAILLLFEFFQERKRGISNTHPSPVIRIYACLIHIVGELTDKPHIHKNLPQISFDDLPKSQNPIYIYFFSKLVNYYINIKQMKEEEFLKEQLFAYEFCSIVGQVVEQAGLPKFRLTKAAF